MHLIVYYTLSHIFFKSSVQFWDALEGYCDSKISKAEFGLLKAIWNTEMKNPVQTSYVISLEVARHTPFLLSVLLLERDPYNVYRG